jgi:putative NADPH-quinone reductase
MVLNQNRGILVILGHSRHDSLCGAIAARYVQGARDSGRPVRELRLGEIAFDPILHNGYGSDQALEPDLVAAQEAIAWSRHVVLVYPTWWGSFPTLLKGFIDRTFLPGFAFQYRKDSPFWDRLLTGRSARLIATMDTPPWYFRLVFRQPGNHTLKRTIMQFCGFKPVRVTNFGSVKASTAAIRQKWLDKTYALGQAGL